MRNNVDLLSFLVLFIFLNRYKTTLERGMVMRNLHFTLGTYDVDVRLDKKSKYNHGSDKKMRQLENFHKIEEERRKLYSKYTI